MDALEMIGRISKAAMRWRLISLSDAALAGLYFLHWQIYLHGSVFASRRCKASPCPDFRSWLDVMDSVDGLDLDRMMVDWFWRYRFKHVADSVPKVFVAWLSGEWSLRLFERIPSPQEVLSLQIAGMRPVTLILDSAMMFGPLLDKANGLAFLLHDLQHANKFFADPLLHRDQRRLFEKLSMLIDSGKLESALRDDIFRVRFDYLISDMNTHPTHALQYLRANLVECYLRKEGQHPNGMLSHFARDEISRILSLLTSESFSAERVAIDGQDFHALGMSGERGVFS